MIPTGWQFALLTLAAYRIYRLVAVDDMPWLMSLRNRSVGATETDGSWSFRRPLLAHALQCPFCAGLWIAMATSGIWWLAPTPALVTAFPLALSTALAAVARVWDA